MDQDSGSISPADARAALATVDLGRRQVVAEIDMPRWYWWGVGLGWMALGVITDLDIAWATAVATFAFGAVHASVAQRVISGRHRTSQVSVRADVVSRHVPALVIGYLLLMALVTIALGFAANADGARHPVTIASVVVGVAVICGGPSLMAAVRRRADRAARPAL